MNHSVIITGSFKGVSGHDNHVRSIVRCLHNRGVQIELRDLPGWSAAKLPDSQQDPWFQALTRPLDAQSHLFFCMPEQVFEDAQSHTVNYTMFESDRIPSHWVEKARKLDLTIVPTESCRLAWLASGVPAQKLRVVPLGVDITRFKPGLPRMNLATSDGKNVNDFSVRFLNVAEVIARKNHIGLLRAWLSATNRSDDAVLILKPGFYMPNAHHRLAQKIQELEQEAGKTLQQAAHIFWISGTLPDSYIPSLYATATHYVSASFGEGFDLPMLESASSGLQLIAPRHSAYLDYLNDDIAHLIGAMERPASQPEHPGLDKLFLGSNWWEPDIEQLTDTIRRIISGRAASKLSARAAVSELTWDRTASELHSLLFDR